MKVEKTVKLEMTNEERKALETVYHMLDGLSLDEEMAVNNELFYCDLVSLRTDLATLYELSGGRAEDL